MTYWNWTRQLELPLLLSCFLSGNYTNLQTEKIGSMEALWIFSISHFLSRSLIHTHALSVFYPQGRLSYWICTDFALHPTMHAMLTHTQVKALRKCQSMYKHSLFNLIPYINTTHRHLHGQGNQSKNGKNKATVSPHRQEDAYAQMSHAVSPIMSPLTTHSHTHTHAHHSVFALGWNYRSDFSLVEM